MEEEKKKTTFLFVFLTYLPVFLLKLRLGEHVGCGIKFHIQRVHTRNTFDGPHYPKTKKYLKKCDDDIIIMFCLGISCFLGRGVHKKYAMWVLIQCIIKFYIQWAISFEIWVNTQGDMLKIRTKKVVFFFLPPKLINIILLF